MPPPPLLAWLRPNLLTFARQSLASCDTLVNAAPVVTVAPAAPVVTRAPVSPAPGAKVFLSMEEALELAFPECEVRKEVDLGGAPNTLVIAEVVGVRIDASLPLEDGTLSVDPESLKPVGRLAGGSYALPGVVKRIPRPRL